MVGGGGGGGEEGGRRKLGIASSAFAEKHGVIIPESLKCLSPPLATKWKSVATVNWSPRPPSSPHAGRLSITFINRDKQD